VGDGESSVVRQSGAERGNDITAIPRLWELLDISGALVAVDEVGWQKKVAEKICEDDLLIRKGHAPVNLRVPMTVTLELLKR